MTTATHPQAQKEEEVCVRIAPNDRGGFSLIAGGLIDLVDVGNYATAADAKRVADFNGFTVIED